ncbi:MAG: response regulator [Bacteroidaceae bacterium]|nr:response regulator [Bacteroidaceae bacterium]
MKTVLIAEDTDSNYLLLSIVLRKRYNLTRAYNGQEAIELYQSSKPDLILMDIKMPIMDGLEATREIRKMDTETPIIALTANAFDSDKQKAKEAGCNGYMAKPIVAAELLVLMQEYLGE